MIGRKVAVRDWKRGVGWLEYVGEIGAIAQEVDGFVLLIIRECDGEIIRHGTGCLRVVDDPIELRRLRRNEHRRGWR